MIYAAKLVFLLGILRGLFSLYPCLHPPIFILIGPCIIVHNGQGLAKTEDLRPQTELSKFVLNALFLHII